MAYWGGYPEPLNDPEYDENSDDITTKDVLCMFGACCFLCFIACLIEFL